MQGASVWMLVAMFAACTGSEPSEAVTIELTSPTSGASFTRDQLGATGRLVARVPVTAVVTGEHARIGLAVGDVAQPDLDATGAGIADVPTGATATLAVTAFDDAGTPLATASVDIAIADPQPATCQDALALYQIEFTAGPERQGVGDPVTAQIPINGLPYRVLDAAEPRGTLFGDCTLILSLARAASIIREHGFVEVSDLGVYNYRCIGGGTPPDCPNGISEHAYARAIDIAGVTHESGDFYSVNDDWIIDPDSEDTCTAPTEPGRDQALHDLICALKAAGTWNIVLTPNYNSDHRNHFHVDLTPDADFIEKR